MPGIQDIPGDQPISFYFPGHATAGTAIEQVGFRAPFRGVITAVEFTPNTAQNGADANSFTLNVRNRGTNGAGTKVPASLAYVNGVNLAALTPSTLTAGAAADRAFDAGDVITAQKAVVGTGLACPPGTITVHLTPA